MQSTSRAGRIFSAIIDENCACHVLVGFPSQGQNFFFRRSSIYYLGFPAT